MPLRQHSLNERRKQHSQKPPPAVSARLERHPVQADCAGCMVWHERTFFKEGLSVRDSRPENLGMLKKTLLIRYQYLILPTIFSPYHFTFILHFSPSFINNESLSSFSSDLPILLKSLLRVVSFFWSPNSIRTILWLVCRSPGSHAREAGVFTRAKPL